MKPLLPAAIAHPLDGGAMAMMFKDCSVSGEGAPARITRFHSQGRLKLLLGQ